jgi:hypothetical protein
MASSKVQEKSREELQDKYDYIMSQINKSEDDLKLLEEVFEYQDNSKIEMLKKQVNEKREELEFMKNTLGKIDYMLNGKDITF